MPLDSDPPGTAEGWLNRAKGDLALSRAPLPKGAFLEDLCYHAQQAAEKALKAVHRRKGWAFRWKKSSQDNKNDSFCCKNGKEY